MPRSALHPPAGRPRRFRLPDQRLERAPRSRPHRRPMGL